MQSVFRELGRDVPEPYRAQTTPQSVIFAEKTDRDRHWIPE